MEPSSKTKHGFTLVEILVVLVIIVVLIGLVATATISGEASAKKSACASNLHQIYLGLSLYWEDNAGYLPPYEFNTGFNPPKGSHEDPKTYELQQTKAFIDSVSPYVKSKKIWFCPADSFAGQDYGFSQSGLDHLYTSYKGRLGIGIYVGGPYPDQIFNADNNNPGGFDALVYQSFTDWGIICDLVIGGVQSGDVRPQWTGHGRIQNWLCLDGHIYSRVPIVTWHY